MERIPLAQRLGTATDAARLVGSFARLYCDDYFPVIDKLAGSNCSADLEQAEGWHLAVWLARLGETFPGSTPDGLACLTYRYAVAPFTKLTNKGEDMNHE